MIPESDSTFGIVRNDGLSVHHRNELEKTFAAIAEKIALLKEEIFESGSQGNQEFSDRRGMMKLRRLKKLLAKISDDEIEVRASDDYGSHYRVTDVKVIDETKEVPDPSKGPFYIGPSKVVKTGRKLVLIS